MVKALFRKKFGTSKLQPFERRIDSLSNDFGLIGDLWVFNNALDNITWTVDFDDKVRKGDTNTLITIKKNGEPLIEKEFD